MHYYSLLHPDFRTFLSTEIGTLKSESDVDLLLDKLFSGKSFKGLRGNYWEQITRIEPDVLKERIRTSILQSDRTNGSIFKILVNESTKIRGYDRCLIKFPVYVNYFDSLRCWFPDAKVIHITRDPRAIAMSKKNDPGGTVKRTSKHPYLRPIIGPAVSLLVVVQYYWASRVHARSRNDENYVLFKYEDLLGDPKATIKTLCDFAGIQFSESMLQPKAGQPSSVTGERRPGVDAHSSALWKSRMGRFEKAAITLLTKGSMQRFGYRPETSDVGHSS